MQDLFWIVTLIPLCWPLVARIFLAATLNWTEVAIQTAVATALTAGVWQLGLSAQTADTQVLNGQVIAKFRDRVSCSHDYSCNCRTTLDSNGRSSETCDTCHEHAADYDWILKSDVGPIRVPRVDRQGAREPQRYTEAAPGDPVAVLDRYVNWVKGSEKSLFHTRDQDRTLAQSYPLVVRDLHYVDRVLAEPSVRPVDIEAWNQDLALALRQIGPERQGNIVVVITANGDRGHLETLRTAWLGGKKNDTVVVIGAEPGTGAIRWAGGFGWSKDEMLYVRLRDDLESIATLDRTRVMPAIAEAVTAHFVRRPMKEFEYLRLEVEPPVWAVALAFLIAIGSSLGLTVFFHHREISVFGSGSPSTPSRRAHQPTRSFRRR